MPKNLAKKTVPPINDEDKNKKFKSSTIKTK